MCEAFFAAGSSFAGEDGGRLRESALTGSSEKSSGVVVISAKVGLGVSCEAVESNGDSEVAEFCFWPNSTEFPCWCRQIVQRGCPPPGFISHAGRGGSHTVLFWAVLDHVLGRMAPIARGRLARIFEKDFNPCVTTFRGRSLLIEANSATLNVAESLLGEIQLTKRVRFQLPVIL